MGMKEEKAFVELLLANNLRLVRKMFDKLEEEEKSKQSSKLEE